MNNHSISSTDKFGLKEECPAPVLLLGEATRENYEAGSRYIPIAPAHYIYAYASTTVTSNSVFANSYTFAKAWRIFWTRWGHARANVNAAVSCIKLECGKCIAKVSKTGTTANVDSIASTGVDMSVDDGGSTATVTIVGGGAIAASDGPKFTFGAEAPTPGGGKVGGGIELSFPGAWDSKAWELGTYMWECPKIKD